MKRICSVVLLVVFLVCTGFAQEAQKLLTNQLIHGSTEFAGKSIAGIQWIAGGAKFSYQEFDQATRSTRIFSYTLKDGKRDLLVDSKDLMLNAGDPPFRFTSYQWSPDEQQVLFVSAPPERQYLSRLTPAGNFFLYDVRTKAFRRLTNVTVPQYNQKFSPDGKRIGFVRSNNIFLLDLTSGAETQLTTDGAERIINGKFDWVYEEEFGISDGWQ